MSTYISDKQLEDLLSPAHGFVDVASCVLGGGVRLIVHDGTLRLEPDEARALAAALGRAADDTEIWATR